MKDITESAISINFSSTESEDFSVKLSSETTESATTRPTDVATSSEEAVGGIQLLVLILLPVATCGINLIVMLCIRLEKTLRSKSYIYIFSLAIADFLVGANSMTGYLLITVYGIWPLGSKMCTLWVLIDFSCCTVSMLHLCFISHDRYSALVKPIQYKEKTTKYVVLQNILAWILGVAVWAPAVLIIRILDTTSSETDCLYFPPPLYTLLQSIFIYFIPIVIMVYFYTRCVHALYVRYSKVQTWVQGTDTHINVQPSKTEHGTSAEQQNTIFSNQNSLTTSTVHRPNEAESEMTSVSDVSGASTSATTTYSDQAISSPPTRPARPASA